MKLVDKGPQRELGENGVKNSFFTVGEAYKYAIERAEKIRLMNPALAQIWDKEAEALKQRLGSEE